MAKLITSSKMNKIGILNPRIVVEKIHKSLLMGRKSSSHCDDYEEVISDHVPEDVKEGHFAVITVDGEQTKRFVIPLSYLTHPRFLMLLEQAAEEYGFDHEGALTIPCRPSELERILAEHWQEGEAFDTSSINSNYGFSSNTSSTCKFDVNFILKFSIERFTSCDG